MVAAIGRRPRCVLRKQRSRQDVFMDLVLERRKSRRRFDLLLVPKVGLVWGWLRRGSLHVSWRLFNQDVQVSSSAQRAVARLEGHGRRGKEEVACEFVHGRFRPSKPANAPESLVVMECGTWLGYSICRALRRSRGSLVGVQTQAEGKLYPSEAFGGVFEKCVRTSDLCPGMKGVDSHSNRKVYGRQSGR